MQSKNYFANYYATLAPKRPLKQFIGQRIKVVTLIVFVKQFNVFQVVIKKWNKIKLNKFYLVGNSNFTNNFIV